MRRIGTALLAIMLLAAVSPTAIADPAYPEVTLDRTEARMMRAAADGREFRVFVGRPEGVAPATGFPVIYVLDADYTFATMFETLRQQARRTEATGVAPTVLVGIALPQGIADHAARREREFTTGIGADGDAFMEFLEGTVKPAIEREFPIDHRRQVLVGHSFGGLFTLHVLFSRPEAFTGYVASSPSIWWGNRAVLDEERRFAARPVRERAGVRVLITMGTAEQTPNPAMITDPQRIAKARDRRMADNARELSQRLAAIGVAAEYVEFPDENHGSVVPAALSRAARFAGTIESTTK